MIVMKFGGTSVESAAALERVADIVRAVEQRHPLVVVSAMGKTTNKLLEAAQDAAAGRAKAAETAVAALRESHHGEASQVTRPEDRAELASHLDSHFTGLQRWSDQEQLRPRAVRICEPALFGPDGPLANRVLAERLLCPIEQGHL